MLKRTDHFTKYVFGSDSFNRTIQNKEISCPQKRSFIGKVNILCFSEELPYVDPQMADRKGL